MITTYIFIVSDNPPNKIKFDKKSRFRRRMAGSFKKRKVRKLPVLIQIDLY